MQKNLSLLPHDDVYILDDCLVESYSTCSRGTLRGAAGWMSTSL